jgi:hypothetical protein
VAIADTGTFMGRNPLPIVKDLNQFLGDFEADFMLNKPVGH